MISKDLPLMKNVYCFYYYVLSKKDTAPEMQPNASEIIPTHKKTGGR